MRQGWGARTFSPVPGFLAILQTAGTCRLVRHSDDKSSQAYPRFAAQALSCSQELRLAGTLRFDCLGSLLG